MHSGPVSRPEYVEAAFELFQDMLPADAGSVVQDPRTPDPSPRGTKFVLDAALLEILRAHRHELRTRDLVERIPNATSAQVGGRLRSLLARGLVEIQRYRNPRNGFEVNAWRATFSDDRTGSHP